MPSASVGGARTGPAPVHEVQALPPPPVPREDRQDAGPSCQHRRGSLDRAVFGPASALVRHAKVVDACLRVIVCRGVRVRVQCISSARPASAQHPSVSLTRVRGWGSETAGTVGSALDSALLSSLSSKRG